jgi:hypothetical protein
VAEASFRVNEGSRENSAHLRVSKVTLFDSHVLEFAAENNAGLLFVPDLTSHHFQAVDRSDIKSLQTYR